MVLLWHRCKKTFWHLMWHSWSHEGSTNSAWWLYCYRDHRHIAGLCGSALGDLVLQAHSEEQVWQHDPCADIVNIMSNLWEEDYRNENKHVFKGTVNLISYIKCSYTRSIGEKWHMYLWEFKVCEKTSQQKCSLHIQVCWHVFGGRDFGEKAVDDGWNQI